MRYKLTFGLGFAAGYVLGTKAGTERYEQIENAWRRFVDTPAVQQAAGVVGAQAGQVIDQAKQAVGGKVSATVGGRSQSGPRSGETAPTAGASTHYPSASATAGTPTGTPTGTTTGTTTPTAADQQASPYPAQDYGGHA